jgi:hypothetical protein
MKSKVKLKDDYSMDKSDSKGKDMNKPLFANHFRKTPIYALVTLLLFVFTSEIVLMLLLEKFNLPFLYAALIDSVLLVGLMFPGFFIYVYKPLTAEIKKREKLRKESEASRNMLLTVLDSLDAIVYVADIKTYELIFLNKFARNIFGDAIGRLCWKILQKDQNGPCEFCSNKKLITDDGIIKGMYAWEFQNTVDGKWYEIRDRAIRWIDGRIVRLEVATDVTLKKNTEKEKEQLIEKLEQALSEVKTLQGIIPICANCKKVRDDKGYWEQVDVYIHKHSQADISHSICPECAKKYYPDLDIYND